MNLCKNSLNQRYSFIPRGLRGRGEERVGQGEGKGWGRVGKDWLETCKLSPTVSFELSCCHSRFNFKKSSPCEMKRYNKSFVKLSLCDVTHR